MEDTYSKDNRVWLDAEEWRGLLSGLTVSFMYMKQILSQQNDFDLLYRSKGKKSQEEEEIGLASSLSMSEIPRGMM